MDSVDPTKEKDGSNSFLLPQLLCGVALHGSGASVVAYDSVRAQDGGLSSPPGSALPRELLKDSGAVSPGEAFI